MKVKDVIEKLRKADPESNVYISTYGWRDDGHRVLVDDGVDSVWTEEYGNGGRKVLYIGRLESASTDYKVEEL